MGALAALHMPAERSHRRASPAEPSQRSPVDSEDRQAGPGVPPFLEARNDDRVGESAPAADAGGAPAVHQIDAAMARSSEALAVDRSSPDEEQEDAQPSGPEPLTEPVPAAHHSVSQSQVAPPGPPPLQLGEGAGGRGSGGGPAGAGSGEGGEGEAGEVDASAETEADDAVAAEGQANAAGAGEGGAEGGSGRGGEGEGGADGGGGAGGGGRQQGSTGGAGRSGEAAAETTLDALATGDVALIDEELAEHQRWGSASARVGAAGSASRAAFVVDQAGGGALGGLGHGALMGAAVGAGSQAIEIGAARLVGRLAGPALARSFPLPAIGAVIGGVFSAYDLAARDWGQTGETIGRFGEGGSIYEQLANSIAAVSEIIGIATAVLNVIAGVIGAISIAMWVITVLTVGVASPLAATLSTIAMAIGLATMVLDGINALVLQRLVTLFRALHTFTSQADPSDVEQQGARIGTAAAASAGFVGGMAGGLAGGGATAAGARRLGLSHTPPRVPDVEPPRAAAGEGPRITADPPPPIETGVPGGDRPALLPPEPVAPRPPGEGGAPVVDPHAPTEAPTPSLAPTEPAAAKPRQITDAELAPLPAAEPMTAADPTSFADLADTVAQLSESPFGDRLAAEAMAPIQDVPRDPTRSPRAVHDAAYGEIPRDRPAGYGGAGLQDQHWTKVRDATVNAAPGTPPATVDAINASRSPLQSRTAHPATLLLTTEGVPAAALPGGERGTRYFIGDTPMGRPAVPESPASAAISAEPGARGGPPRAAGTRRYGSEHRFADAFLIPEMRRQIQDSRARAGLPPLDDVQLAVAAGEQARYVMEGVPRTDLAQHPVEPWSGVVVERPRTPMQMLLAPEVSMPDLHARGRTVDLPAAPRADVSAPAAVEAANPKQLSLGLETSETPRPAIDRSAGARPAGEGGTRNQRPLTPDEFAAFAAMAEEMGMPREQIQQASGPTAYLPGSFDQLLIGPDILPLAPEARPPGLANPANAALDPRAVLGHEIIGHREAELAGQARIEPWHEEFQASTRAALHTPDLPREQMWLLTQDAAARRRHQTREGTIFVDIERYGVPAGGAPVGGTRAPSHFRAQDQLPSVIVDLASAGGRRVADPGGPIQPPPSRSLPGAAVRPSLGTLVASSAAARTSGRASAAGLAEGAPRDAATARSTGLASTARGDAIASVNPLARMAWRGYFGSGRRNQRIDRGGSVGAVIGGVGGGALGAFVGRRVGEGVARRAEDFNAGLERGAEPIVEPVNPAYPPPPGSGSRQEIADMQNSLLALLQARAQAVSLQAMMADDAAHHEGNTVPLADFNQRNTQAVAATQAHREATARRNTANQQQQEQERSVSGALSDYGNRAAGLAMITGPLEAFTRFTYLANALPDSPNVLRGAKRGILKMNSDGQSFLDAMNGVDAAVGEQQAAQPERSSGITENAGRLAATASGAGSSQAQLGQSGSQGQALAAVNSARAADSRQRESAAAGTGAQLDTQAEETQTRITSLSAQWQAWAVAHRQARIDAMARTRAAMIARGWRPREESGAGGGS